MQHDLGATRHARRLLLRGWRDLIGPLMGAFAIDNHREMQEAWKALNEARADKSFPADTLAKMEAAFYAFPPHSLTARDGSTGDTVTVPTTVKASGASASTTMILLEPRARRMPE